MRDVSAPARPCGEELEAVLKKLGLPPMKDLVGRKFSFERTGNRAFLDGEANVDFIVGTIGAITLDAHNPAFGSSEDESNETVKIIPAVQIDHGEWFLTGFYWVGALKDDAEMCSAEFYGETTDGRHDARTSEGKFTLLD